MNLHAEVMGLISQVNPNIQVTIQKSIGVQDNDDGSETPLYTNYSLTGQLQSFSANELKQMDYLNVQDTNRKIYLSGDWTGIVRPDNKGGDLIILPDGSKWLVVQVLQDWSITAGWVALAITRQNEVQINDDLYGRY